MSKDNNNFTLKYDNGYSGKFPIRGIMVDNETGVNYIVMSEYHAISITPRLNSDGTLYVSKGEINDSTN